MQKQKNTIIFNSKETRCLAAFSATIFDKNATPCAHSAEQKNGRDTIGKGRDTAGIDTYDLWIYKHLPITKSNT